MNAIGTDAIGGKKEYRTIGAKELTASGGFSPKGEDVIANVGPGKNVMLSGTGTYKGVMTKKPVSTPRQRTPSPYDRQSGGYGVRNELVNAGLNDSDIGWDGQYVTYKGQRAILPSANIKGTAYANRGDIQRFINQQYAQEGEPLVRANRYASQNGQTGLLGWNDATRQVMVDGVPIEYAYIDDNGNAWVRQSALDAAFAAADERQGIKSSDDLIKAYDLKVSNAQQSAADSAAALENWKMTDKDIENDAAYQAYKKMYLREAAKAYTDGLATMAAQNGGNLSSAAVMAAGAGQQQYLERLNDIKPEIYKMAYERFLNAKNLQIQNQYQKMSNAANLYSRQYEANRDRIVDANAARDDVYKKALAELEVRGTRESLQQTEFENAINRGIQRGFFTPEECELLRVPEGTSPFAAAALYQWYLWENGGKQMEQDKADINTASSIAIDNNTHRNNVEASRLDNDYDLRRLAQQNDYTLSQMDKQAGIDEGMLALQNYYDMQEKNADNARRDEEAYNDILLGVADTILNADAIGSAAILEDMPTNLSLEDAVQYVVKKFNERQKQEDLEGVRGGSGNLGQ